MADGDWDQLRQVVVGGVLAWAVLRGSGWLIAWTLCGCSP